MSSSRKAAIDLAQRGLPVFRIRRGTKKYFVDTDWAKGGASADVFEVDAKFPFTEEYNIGVNATGHVVLDVDTKNGRMGPTELKALEAQHGALPRTYTQGTPSGGRHYIFDAGGEQYGQRNLSPGIDVRATNGYFLGAGSEFEGRQYTVEVDAPIARLPEWLRELLHAAPTKDLNAGQVKGELDTEAAIAAATTYLTGSAPPSVEGQSGDLNAFKVAAQCLDRGVSPAKTLELMLEHWNERCEPSWDAEELEKKVDSAAVNRQKAIGSDNPLDGFTVIDLDDDGDTYFEENLFAWHDTKEDSDAIKPMAWVVRGLLARENVTLLGAPGGSGKSAYSLQLATAIALGKGELVGREISERTNVLIINNEDSRDIMRQRLAAVFEYHGLPREEAHGRIFLWSGLKRKFRMTRKTGKGSAVSEGEFVGRLRRTIAKHNIGVVVYDPLASMHDSSETDNSEMQRVMDVFTEFGSNMLISSLIPAHTVKPQQASSESYAGNVNAIRGASAIKDAARVALTGFRMSEKDGERYGVEPHFRHRYVRFDDAKANHSEMAAEPTWFKMESIKVGTEPIVALKLAELTPVQKGSADAAADAIPRLLADHGEMSLAAVVRALLTTDPLFAGMKTKELETGLMQRFSKSRREIIRGVVVDYDPAANGGVFSIGRTDA